MGWLDKFEEKPRKLKEVVIRGKKYPANTIVTNNPNDPRIRAYQDSLLIHNAGEEAYRDFMQSRASLGISNTSWSRIKNKYNSPNVSSAVNRLEKLNNEELSFDKQTSNEPIWKDAIEVGIGRIGVLNKPIQPIIYQPFVNRMTPKGFPTPTIIPNERVQPDVIQIDPTQHAAYQGIDITHQTDGMGRWMAKMNKVTTPGVRGRLSTPNPEGDYTVEYGDGGEVKKKEPPLLPKAFMYSYLRSPVHLRNVEDEVKKLWESKLGEPLLEGRASSFVIKKDRDDILKEQRDKLSSLKVETTDDPTINSYYPRDHKVKLNDYMGAGAHEFAHATEPFSMDIRMQRKDLFQTYQPRSSIQSTIRRVGDSLLNAGDSDVLQGFALDHYIDNIYDLDADTHDIDPSEVRSDIYQLRYNLYNKGVYDPRKNAFKAEHLKKAKELYNKESETLKRLFDAYDDEDLIKFMNSVVQNNSKDNKVKAQNGGRIQPANERKSLSRGSKPTGRVERGIITDEKPQFILANPTPIYKSFAEADAALNPTGYTVTPKQQKSEIAELMKREEAEQARRRSIADVYVDPQTGQATVQSTGIQPTASPIDFAVGGIGALASGGPRLLVQAADILYNPLPINLSLGVRKALKNGISPYGYELQGLLNIPENLIRTSLGKEKVLSKGVRKSIDLNPRHKRLIETTRDNREDAWGTYLGLQKGGENIIPDGIDPITGYEKYKLVSRDINPEDATDLSHELGQLINEALNKEHIVGTDGIFGVMGGFQMRVTPDKKSLMYRDIWDLQPFMNKNIPKPIKEFEVSSIIPGAKPFVSEGKLADIKKRYGRMEYQSLPDVINHYVDDHPNWGLLEEISPDDVKEMKRQTVRWLLEDRKKGKPFTVGYVPETYDRTYGDIAPYLNVRPYPNQFAHGGIIKTIKGWMDKYQ